MNAQAAAICFVFFMVAIALGFYFNNCYIFTKNEKSHK